MTTDDGRKGKMTRVCIRDARVADPRRRTKTEKEEADSHLKNGGDG